MQVCIRDAPGISSEDENRSKLTKVVRHPGSIVDTRGGTEADIKTRISKARATFHILRNAWKFRIIGKTTKISLFNTNAKSVLLYGAETWRMNNAANRLSVCLNVCLFICLSACLSDRLLVCFFVCLIVCLSVCLSV